MVSHGIERVSWNTFKAFKLINEFDFQRNLSDEHVLEIIKGQKEYKEKYGDYLLPTPLIIGILDDKKYLIDGCHRYEFLKRINDDSIRFYMHEIIIKDKEHLHQLWLLINKNLPVQIFSEKYESNTFSSNIEKEINKVYFSYVKVSKSPQKPNINLSAFKSQIMESELPELINYDVKIFMKLLSKFNEEVKKMIEGQNKKLIDATLITEFNSCKNKSATNPLFWRLFKNPEECLVLLHQKKKIEEIVELDKSFSCKIPKSIREKVWEKCAGKSTTTTCRLKDCDNQLERDRNWHCSHIMSVYHGGTLDINNLTVLCRDCNLRIGKNNMKEEDIKPNHSNPIATVINPIATIAASSSNISKIKKERGKGKTKK